MYQSLFTYCYFYPSDVLTLIHIESILIFYIVEKINGHDKIRTHDDLCINFKLFVYTPNLKKQLLIPLVNPLRLTKVNTVKSELQSQSRI